MTTETKNLDNKAFILNWNGLKDIIKPGDAVGIASAPHGYKTSTMLALLGQIACLNKPTNTHPKQKPLIHHYSFEDKISTIYAHMFHLLKNTSIHDQIFSTENPPRHEKVAYVQRQMEVNGFHYQPGALLDREALLSTIGHCYNFYKEKGQTVEVLAIDGMGGKDCRGVQRFCKEKQITLIATLELSSEVRQLRWSGIIDPINFLDAIAGAGYIDNNADFHMDVVLYTNIIKHGGARYLAVKVGKCRRYPSDSDQLKTFFMELPSSGVIPDQDPEDGVMFELPSIS